MADIDRWVIANAFLQLSKRPDLLASIDVFSINLSGASMANPGLLSHIETCLFESGLEAKHFCFEVTETEQIQNWEKANEILVALKQRGFAISLDDFGTGLASFDYLNRVAFDFVKIDGSFVKNLSRESRNRQIIEAVVLVAKSRGILTIAEFVETESERALLIDLHVDYAQGYVAHKPEPIADMQMAVPSS
jgi:EAL domain-containing protein (putative c-di-GMP-specific phosphodiesterase class I)